MRFFATGRVIHPEQLGPHQDEESRVLGELRAAGTVREAVRPAAGHGVLSILEGTDLDEVRSQMGRLPFVALGLMTFDYTEVVDL